MKSSSKFFLILLTLLLPALLLGLGERPVSKIQEVRIAETAREMLVSGDWAVPRYNGELRLQKPPLPYWLTATSYHLAGVNALATRLPAVLFGLLSTLLLWVWLRRELDMKVAANSVLILAASYIGLRYFRSGEADAMLLFFTSAACLIGHDILQGKGNTGRRCLFALALGLGFLSKGPAALAIPLLTLLLMAMLEKRAGRLQPSPRAFFSLPGLALLLIAAFGWYVWILVKFPEISQQFFGKQVDETFVSGTHTKPLWWYLAHWAEFFAPWGILLIPAGWMAWRGRRTTTLPALLRFAWIWLAVVFVLLTATVNKQMQYALLFAPPLAIILGHYLAHAAAGFAKANRLLFWLFCVAFLAGAIFALQKSADLPFDLLWLALPAVPLIVRRLLRETGLSWPVLLVAGLTATAYLYGETYLSKEPRKIAAQTVMQEAIRYTPLYQIKTPLNDGALSFYAGRVVPPAAPADIDRLLKEHRAIWLVGEELPELPGVSTQSLIEVDGLSLYQLQRQP